MRTASRGRPAVFLASAAAWAMPVALVSAYRTGPPPGYSGGFGEDTCHYCHYEFEPSTDSTVFVVSGFPETYVGGERYVLEISVAAERLGAAGFQLTVRFSEGDLAGRNAGSLESLSERTAIDVNEKNGVAYARQRLQGVFPQKDDRATWQIVWTAPATRGRVRLNAAANAGDGDESQMGDRVYTYTRDAGPSQVRP